MNVHFSDTLLHAKARVSQVAFASWTLSCSFSFSQTPWMVPKPFHGI